MAKITVSPKSVGSVTMDAIPEQVKQDVEDIFELLTANPEQDVRVEESDWTVTSEDGKEFSVFNDVTGAVNTSYKGATAKDEAEAEAMSLNKTAVLTWLRNAKNYGEQRMDENGQSAKLKVRAAPKRNLPDNIKYVNVSRDIPGDGTANTNKTSR